MPVTTIDKIKVVPRSSWYHYAHIYHTGSRLVHPWEVKKQWVRFRAPNHRFGSSMKTNTSIRHTSAEVIYHDCSFTDI